MTEPRLVRVALRIATGFVLAFLYLPLVVLAIYAFNESRLQVWPPTSFSLKWFGEALANSSLIEALVNSLIVAVHRNLHPRAVGEPADRNRSRFDVHVPKPGNANTRVKRPFFDQVIAARSG